LYKLERNGKIVERIVMSGDLGYKVYQIPEIIDLVFDTKEQAKQVANILDAKVVVHQEYARVA
tara:strand:+ start:15970 stop:16158 length:189 start_codon:yes stop_codon:yes gene_type:complete